MAILQPPIACDLCTVVPCPSRVSLLGLSSHLRHDAFSVLEIEADRHRRPGCERARTFDIRPELEGRLGLAVVQWVYHEQCLVDRFDRTFHVRPYPFLLTRCAK